MKTFVAFLCSIFLLINVSGKSNKHEFYTTKIDTLSINGDSVLAKISTFSHDTLLREEIAFLLPDSIRIPRSRLTGNLFKKTIYISRVIKHGKTTDYQRNGMKKITEYNYDKIISTAYYNKSNKEISKDEFVTDTLTIGPCSTETREFIYYKPAKKK